MKNMDMKLYELESECDKLRKRLSTHEELQCEVEMLQQELQSSLESHKKLQEVALAFEEENRNIQSKYTEQLKDKSKFDSVKIELENEVETKMLSYVQLEKNFNKMKEKADSVNEIEEEVFTLENERKMSMARIYDLEESLNASYEDSDARVKELQEKIKELAQENTEVNSKLLTYIEEVEDMDSKMENLEKENETLKENLNKMKEMEMFSSHVQHIEELELEKEELQKKLEKEKKRREDTENELFKTEEELENYISRDEMYNDDNNNKKDSAGLLVAISEINMDELDECVRVVIYQKEKVIRKLETDKKLLVDKVKSFDEELEVLLEENGMLAKSNMELQNQKTKTREDYESKIMNLQEKLNDMLDERKQIEQEKFNRLVSSAEKEYEYSQKQKEETRENERLRSEMKVVQGNLSTAEDKYIELQGEMEKKEKEYQGKLDVVKDELKSELNSLKVALEGGKLCKHDEKEKEDRNRLLNQMESTMANMKDGYEQRIGEQNSTIKNLEEQITTIRIFYENKSISTGSSTSTPPTTVKNGKCYLSHNEKCCVSENEGRRNSLNGKYYNSNNGKSYSSMVDIRTLRDDGLDDNHHRLEADDHPETDHHIPNGHHIPNIHHIPNGHHSESDDVDSDSGDGLSEREMRRISYKVADGSWKRLAREIPINEQDLNQIMNSNSNPHEKVYQLLNCWRTVSKIPRTDLLRELTQYIDPNRKDVIKFLREMAGISTKERNSIKTRFRKLKLSVRR